MPGITIEKAIEILSNSAFSGSTTFDQDFRDAEKLGIEAMKRISLLRDGLLQLQVLLLPGEALG